ncbi:MAG TPA: hypothetical protein VGY13_10620 [Solirubrobacteraceae bacterium]|jgi:hypothetical protein|nr:hypothetical protein [Solirubrobacteraceae bacterium]
MLDRATQRRVIRTTEQIWTAGGRDAELDEALRGGSVSGRDVAKWVEKLTTTELKAAFGARATFEIKKDGTRSKSSIGDIWIKGGGIFNPINIKTSVISPRGAGGSPNIVALKKVTAGVFKRQIDSYYLLFVHLVNEQPPSVRVRLVDLFHIVRDYVRFDSGHGQLMLNAKKFHDHPPPPKYAAVEASAALAYLQEIRADGNRRLAANREKDLRTMTAAMAGFDGSTPIDQEGMSLEAFR